MKLSTFRTNIEKTHKWGLENPSNEIRKTAEIMTPAEFYAWRILLDLETDLDYRFEDFDRKLARNNVELDGFMIDAIEEIKDSHREAVNAILTDPEYWDKEDAGTPPDVSFRIEEAVEMLGDEKARRVQKH